ncbi:MAG: Tad domain-containing protein [Thermodesulfobacteriota bacterium]
MLVALLLPALLGMAGLAVDAGNLYLAHSRLQAAVDAGALAGSLELPFDPEVSTGKVSAAAAAMVQDNYADAVLDSVSAGAEVRSVVVAAHADVPLILMPVLGLSSGRVEARAAAGFNNLEVVLVIDNTGSMKGAPIQQANLAAENLVNLLIPEGALAAIKVGLVPFRGMVRVGANADGLAPGCRNADGSLNNGLRPEYLAAKYRYPAGSTLRVDSDTCPAIPPILPLSDNRDAIVSAIESQNALGSGSGTAIGEGIKWARHVLSPEAPFREGSADDDMRKIIILLTDGDTEDGVCGGPFAISYTPNNYWTNAHYGMLDMGAHCNDGGGMNRAMLDQAAAAKAQGIEIFTIRYGVSDSTDIALMKAAASSKPGADDHYFNAPSPYDLDTIFRLIGRQLGWRLLD